jgi:Raf kinase inhibitor-like YbhB/YbcL family protein
MYRHKWMLSPVILIRALPMVALLWVLTHCASQRIAAPEQPQPVSETPTPLATRGEQTMAFQLTSSVFAEGQPIPSLYTCDGEDISPPLAWSEPPIGVSSFALIVDDPDAPSGTWVHWVLFDVPSDVRRLPEAVAPEAELADGSRQGDNSWHKLGYGGPCPPTGTHRYFFQLYALDSTLALEATATKQQLLDAMGGHILGQARLMGTYTRQ